MVVTEIKRVDGDLVLIKREDYARLLGAYDILRGQYRAMLYSPDIPDDDHNLLVLTDLFSHETRGN